MPDLNNARNWYPQADLVHGFEHVERVYRMAERLAVQEGADLEIVRAAALLHDAIGSLTNTDIPRTGHQHASAQFARQVLLEEGWPDARITQVEHCIRSHRFRDEQEQPHTLEAQILFDADKLDAIGAIGVARAIGYSVQHGHPAYSDISAGFIETGCLEPGEWHSSYHEFIFKLRHIKDRLYTFSARSIGDERHRYTEEFFSRLKAEAGGE